MKREKSGAGQAALETGRGLMVIMIRLNKKKGFQEKARVSEKSQKMLMNPRKR